MRKKLETILPVVLLIVALFVIFVAITRGQVASGGQFSLEKQVAAGGGNQMGNPGYSQAGTAGQSFAGTRSTGGGFALYSGFWTPDDFGPTAATAVIRGRVLTADGRGIRNAAVTVTYPDGSIHSVLTGSLGFYEFSGIPVGSIYVVSISSARFTFAQPSVMREVTDDVRDLDFVADGR